MAVLLETRSLPLRIRVTRWYGSNNLVPRLFPLCEDAKEERAWERGCGSNCPASGINWPIRCIKNSFGVFQILDALWQITKDDYSWSNHELVDGKNDEEDEVDNVVYPNEIGIEMDTEKEPELPSSPPVPEQHEEIDDTVNVKSRQHDLQGKII